MELNRCFRAKLSRTSASHSFWKRCRRAGIDVADAGRGGAAFAPETERMLAPSVQSGRQQLQHDVQKILRLTGFDGNEVRVLQLVSSRRVRAIFRDVLENETALEDLAGLLRHHRVLRRLPRDCAVERHAVFDVECGVVDVASMSCFDERTLASTSQKLGYTNRQKRQVSYVHSSWSTFAFSKSKSYTRPPSTTSTSSPFLHDVGEATETGASDHRLP